MSNIFSPIFKEHNEKVRQAHIKRYGVDINKLTPKQKEQHFKKHTLIIDYEKNIL